MTTDEVKAWLRSYRYLKAEIDRTEEEIAQWNARAARLTQSYSGMPSGGGNADQIPNAVEKIMELEEKLKGQVNDAINRRNQIETAIQTVSNADLRLLLKLRYIDGNTWETIAVKMNYNYRWILYLHGRALQALQNTA